MWWWNEWTLQEIVSSLFVRFGSSKEQKTPPDLRFLSPYYGMLPVFGVGGVVAAITVLCSCLSPQYDPLHSINKYCNVGMVGDSYLIHGFPGFHSHF